MKKNTASTSIKSILIILASILVSIALIFLMFMSMLSTGNPLKIFDLLYRDVVPEYTKSVEEIMTLDGKPVTLYVKERIYTNSYSFTLDTDEYPAWTYKNPRVPIGDQTWPISFDVVKNTPWIVLPMRGGRQCAKYGLPREGMVFFKLENDLWKQMSYDQAPENLRVNLLQNRHEYKTGSAMDKANCPHGIYDWADGFVCLDSKGGVYANKETTIPSEANYGRKVTPVMRQYLDAKGYNNWRGSEFLNKDGSGKTIKELAESNMELPNIADTNSCYYLNPPVDPDERRSLKEYVEMEAVQVQASVVRVSDERIELKDSEEHEMYALPKTLGNCDKVVRRHYVAQLAAENHVEFSQVAGVPEGTFKSPGSAVRVEINASAGAGTHSFYLPIRGFSFARISLMNCQPDRVVVYFGSDTNSQQILEYSLDARLLKKWSVQLQKKETMPLHSEDQRMISDVTVGKGRISMAFVYFKKHGYNQGKKIQGEITKQYFLEAKLP